MDDLISRAALLKECEECQKTDPRFEKRGWANHFINEAGEPSTEWYCVEDMIENAPAVDAVPVVRCGDCEHFIDMSGTSYPSYCYKHTTFDTDGEFDNVFSVEPDKYCAWGERRGSE